MKAQEALLFFWGVMLFGLIVGFFNSMTRGDEGTIDSFKIGRFSLILFSSFIVAIIPIFTNLSEVQY